MLISLCKDVLPLHLVSSVIYNYKCQCESEYIGIANQMLETRIDQHVPAKIHHRRCDNFHKLVNTSGLVIAECLINNDFLVVLDLLSFLNVMHTIYMFVLDWFSRVRIESQ